MAKSRSAAAFLTLTLLFSLIAAVLPSLTATATPDEVKWSTVTIPTEGIAGKWVLASGSDVQHPALAIDGTIYCYATPSGTSNTLFRSRDGGYSWSPAGNVQDAVVDIATAPDDASTVYYATLSGIYKSTDAGASFSLLALNQGGAGSNNVAITSLAVARLGGGRIITVGTRDSDSSQYGGIYTLDENKPPVWLNTNLGSYDVLAIAFSPSFAADRQLVAVVTDEKDTLVTTKVGDAGWGQTFGGATIKSVVARAATIAFPDDYDATTDNQTLFVGLDTGSENGDVYRVKGMRAPFSSMATDLDIGWTDNLRQVDVSGLAVSGNATAACLLAGTAGSSRVYISTDGGLNWTKSSKEPTGQSRTYLLMAQDFATSRRAYAATSGAESAFSYSSDGGLTWNQVGLIDTQITSSGLIDLAVSPNYSQENTLFLLTWGGEYSLWRTLDGGARWERVFSSAPPNIDTINLVKVSPNYGRDSQVIFLAGTGGGGATICISADGGQSFTPRGAPMVIDAWAVTDDNSLFLGSYNGTDGLIYHTANSGFSYSNGVVVGHQPLKSIVLSPNYKTDQTILVGNTLGWVYLSSDNGTTFERLGQQLPLSNTGVGQVTLAFDPKFASNQIVYAATDAPSTSASQERIFRFTIGKSETWESIDSTLPVGSMLNQLIASADGVLYAANSQAVDNAEQEGGLERSLNPDFALGATFETVIRGLNDNTTLTGLWVVGNQLWSLDTTNTRLLTYLDTLAGAIVLTSPSDKAAGVETDNVRLSWKSLKGTTEYQWQVDYDNDFSSVPSGFEGNTEEISVRLPALEMGTTYYWRVRAAEPVLSPWSAKWSFTTSLGKAAVAPELKSPEAGATGMPIRPIFQWSAISGAEQYELMVSAEVSFTNPVIARTGDLAVPATAWQSDVDLDYNATYYWKVRATGPSSYSAWSAVSAFTTEITPSPTSSTPLPTPQSSPAPLTTTTSMIREAPPLGMPTWALYLMGLGALIVILLLVIILMLVVRRHTSQQ
jgi:hypothetical protein